jgi:hypothetical protein
LNHNGEHEFAIAVSTRQPADFVQLLDSAPIPLWLKDYSALQALFFLLARQRQCVKYKSACMSNTT